MIPITTEWKLNCIGFSEIFLYPEDYLDCNSEEEIKEKIIKEILPPSFDDLHSIEILNINFNSLDEDEFKKFISEWKELKNKSTK
jgi:hypothetical protein